ncbi:class II aldolase/adducin family protein [Robbsia sp. KACC 23696]|uniref:class II aldolase/adducin family protein n=1 Tax=Robbsia sp. KACC 23696 TaxID=3149231 RepID=UPI00325B873A
MMTSDANLQRDTVNDFCRRIGEDPLLVQGAGGNVSWKDETTMWVKASGRWLAHAADTDIFVPVALTPLREAVAAGDFAITPEVVGESTLKPSIETLLHALMPHRYVAHLHAVEPLAHLVRDGGVASLSKALNGRLTWQSVPYRKPGAALAQGVSDALRLDPNVDIVLLENHGIVIGAESVLALEKRLRDIAEWTAVPVSGIPIGDTKSRDSHFAHPAYHRIDNNTIQLLAFDDARFARLQRDWALFPDHVVFLGAAPVVFHNGDVAGQALAGQTALPELIFVKNDGIFATDTFNIAKVVQLQCYYDVMSRQQDDDPIHTLSDVDVSELLNWDAERYRQSLNK